ncbi:LacI family DNA-binding transcriptional regulator [Luteimicrobium sp. NPDC057192]|uniref:LacI family DNA-binding transcriptional regulator n=1 Tax=Luteimicrobium sp. NPDC057192 TaxID=3346042 RepID=UPI003625E537
MVEKSKPATLGDVARLAGVSIATASKALNGRAQVRDTTREKVMRSAEALAFIPNPLARGLLSGQTGTVGLLTSDLEGRFSIPIMMGAEDAFGAGSTSVFLCDARGDAIREQHQVRALLSRHVDGLIVVGARPDPRPPLAGDINVPVVYAYAPSEDPDDSSVTSDNVQGGRLAAEHLLSTGRRSIGIITGDRGYGAAHDRLAGALSALHDAGIEPVQDALFGSWSEGWGRGAARVLLEAHPELDGLICGSDQVARGAMDALRELGREVPDDVAVIGHDNWEVLAMNARPPLSTIDMNLQELGRRAAGMLFDAIGGSPTHGVEKLPCRLMVRGSTTPTS